MYTCTHDAYNVMSTLWDENLPWNQASPGTTCWRNTTFWSETGFGPLFGTSRRLAFSELKFEKKFLWKLCMGVDGVDLLITFFLTVRIWFLIAHSIRLDETRRMGQLKKMISGASMPLFDRDTLTCYSHRYHTHASILSTAVRQSSSKPELLSPPCDSEQSEALLNLCRILSASSCASRKHETLPKAWGTSSMIISALHNMEHVLINSSWIRVKPVIHARVVLRLL